jgi:hypothetical protein
MLLASNVVVTGGVCVQGFETSSSWVGVGVSIDDEIRSFRSWNMETIIVLKNKFVHISSIILASKNLYFYKVCRLRF